MDNFEFSNNTVVVFGKDAELSVGARVAELSPAKRTLFVHYGDGVIEKMGLYASVLASLKEHGIEAVEFKGVQPNPTLGTVRKGVEKARAGKVDFILGIGGGSVIDTCKAISAGMNLTSCDLWDLYTQNVAPSAPDYIYQGGLVFRLPKAVPIGVISTMAASGSETSWGSVITNEATNEKLDIDCADLRPRFAILNPALTVGIPPFLSACGILDVIAHVFENYFCANWNNDMTDRICEALMKSTIVNGRKVMINPACVDARGELMFAAATALNGFIACGRAADWAMHFIDHEIGGQYNITHAAGLATIIPAWMKYSHSADVNRFVQYGVRVWDVDMQYDNPEDIALEAIRRTEDFIKELGLKTKLSDLGIGDDRFDLIADKCTKNGPMGSFKKLYKEDVLAILRMAL
jgi:alcohol dehydrogenase YqhD (iron-dependent ADH family)